MASLRQPDAPARSIRTRTRIALERVDILVPIVSRPFAEKAQRPFTDANGRIVKRAGGEFDASCNAQTAVDEQAQIIVAAELTNCDSDAGRWRGLRSACGVAASAPSA